MPPGIHRKEGIAGEVVTSRDAEGRCTKSRRWGLVHQKGAGGRFWMAAATRGCQRRPRSAPQGGSSGSTSCPSSSASVASSLIPRERVNFRAKTMMDELSGSRSGVGGHDHELLHRCAPTISPEDSPASRVARLLTHARAWRTVEAAGRRRSRRQGAHRPASDASRASVRVAQLLHARYCVDRTYPMELYGRVCSPFFQEPCFRE